MKSDIKTSLKSLRLHGMAIAWEELIQNGVTTRVDSSQWLLEHLLEALHFFDVHGRGPQQSVAKKRPNSIRQRPNLCQGESF